MNLNNKTTFFPKNVHIQVAYLKCPLFKTYHFSTWNDITVSLKTKYEMNILFNTYTYILYIHTTAVIFLKNDRNKIHTFYKVLTPASTSVDDWYHDVHSKLADFGMHINTNALLYPPPPVRTGSSHLVCPFHILCISRLLWLKNTNLCCTVFLILCSVVVTSSPSRICYWSLRFCFELKNL